jgi:PAS domain S-box-containing protein
MSKEDNGPEDALTSSEQELRLLVEAIPTLVWRAAPDGNFEYVNKRMLEYLGAPLGEVIGWGWMNEVHPDDVAFKVKTWLKALESESPHDVVCRIRGADGRYRWFEVRGEPLRASDGTVLSWYGVLIDIDDRRKAEDALRESEYKLRQITETQPGLLWSNGPDGEPTHINQRMLDYSGMRFEDFKHRGWEAFVHPADYPETAKAFYHAIQTGTSYEGVMRLRRADGEFRWHHARCEPLRDRQGRIIQWYGLSVDIEERKQAEDQLRRSEAYLAEAQCLSHTGSAAFNDTTILYWSDETYRILGFDPRDGLPSYEAAAQRTHPDDQERVREQARRAVQQKRDFSLEYRILLPTGSIKHIEMNAHPKFSEGGELVEVVTTLIDVTERKRAQEEHERLRQLESDLAHMNRLSMMGELAASLAHEITQPIAAARNNARAALNFLVKQPPDLRELSEALGCVVGDADRAGNIIDRIRDHIKKAPPRKHRFDLNEAINEVIVLARSAIAQNGVSAQTRLTEGLAPVGGDRVQLQQVILNLVLNAVEAMSAVDEGVRELLISTEQSQTNGVLVAVRDSGPGLAPDALQHLFEAFHTTKPSGLGLGLSICRSIVEANGGRLWASANALQGAIFQFTLPAETAAPNPDAPRQ